jgi:hypothetical protein
MLNPSVPWSFLEIIPYFLWQCNKSTSGFQNLKATVLLNSQGFWIEKTKLLSLKQQTALLMFIYVNVIAFHVFINERLCYEPRKTTFIASEDDVSLTITIYFGSIKFATQAFYYVFQHKALTTSLCSELHRHRFTTNNATSWTLLQGRFKLAHLPYTGPAVDISAHGLYRTPDHVVGASNSS